MIDRVFVYGTLMTKGRYHHLVAPFVRRVSAGWVPGMLVDLGGYPGWVAGQGRVLGEILCLDGVDEVLRILDNFEDYNGPGHAENLYERVRTEVLVKTDRVSAWAYRYVGPTAGRRRIPEGFWRSRGLR